MSQETATEWLFMHLHEMGDGRETDKILEQANEMEKQQKLQQIEYGVFLHWVIKHYSTETYNGLFGWVDSMGNRVTVKEIVEEYYKQQ